MIWTDSYTNRYKKHKNPNRQYTSKCFQYIIQSLSSQSFNKENLCADASNLYLQVYDENEFGTTLQKNEQLSCDVLDKIISLFHHWSFSRNFDRNSSYYKQRKGTKINIK